MLDELHLGLGDGARAVNCPRGILQFCSKGIIVYVEKLSAREYSKTRKFTKLGFVTGGIRCDYHRGLIILMKVNFDGDASLHGRLHLS